MTSHHQPNTEFSRSAPRAAEKAADTRPSLLPVSAANYDGQHGSTHERGRGVPYELGINLVCRASIPADPRRATQFRLSVTFVSLKLGRSRVGSGPFAADGRDCNPGLASTNNTLRDCRLKRVAKGLPSHFKNSVPNAHDHEAKGVGSDQKAIGVYQNDDC